MTFSDDVGLRHVTTIRSASFSVAALILPDEFREHTNRDTSNFPVESDCPHARESRRYVRQYEDLTGRALEVALEFDPVDESLQRLPGHPDAFDLLDHTSRHGPCLAAP